MSGFKKDQSGFIVKLDEIGEGGYHLSCSKTRDWISNIVGEVQGIDFVFVDDLHIQMQIYKSEKDVFANGLISTTVKMHCVRCLDEFDLSLELTFHYTLCPSNDKKFLPEVEINKEDLDVLNYQGDSIDIAQMIREQILLNIPPYPLCEESCKGICPRCGINLNQGSCQCRKEEGPFSKFEILKKLSIKQ